MVCIVVYSGVHIIRSAALRALTGSQYRCAVRVNLYGTGSLYYYTEVQRRQLITAVLLNREAAVISR